MTYLLFAGDEKTYKITWSTKNLSLTCDIPWGFPFSAHLPGSANAGMQIAAASEKHIIAKFCKK